MSSVKKNIAANFVGRIWISVIGIVFVPVYIHFIGIEAYGLIGVFTTVQSILALLDMGLSTTLNRELAKQNSHNDNGEYVINLVYTMERVYWFLSLITCLALAIASWFFASRWVNAEHLNNRTVVMAFMLMAINFGFQFPGSLYQGGLMGLQKQVRLNIILGIIASLKAFGAILILWLISPTVIAFLLWQLLLSVIQLLLLRKYLWNYLPAIVHRPFFDKTTIKKSGRYAAGIMGISALTILLTQSDKIILSNLIKLTDFAYYALASTVSSTLAMVLFPVTSAMFPKITELINKEKHEEFQKLFHASSQLVSLIIIPLGISLFIFSHDIILAWTRNAEIAAKAGPILKYLIIGTTINSLMTIPYQYTLSIGWLRFGINISAVAIIFFLPMIFFATYRYGALGAAFIWMILNISYFIFAMIYLFSKQLKTEKIKWYLVDIGRPLLICLLFAVPFFLSYEYFHFSNFMALLLLAFCLLVCFSATLWFGTPTLKPGLLSLINKLKWIEKEGTKGER